jgi:hypothetical protein
MRKTVSFLLAILMLVSLGTTGFADEENTLTTDLILERLTEGDENSETVGDQVSNGAVRLAEMVVALDNLLIETQDEADHLNNILDMLAEIDVPEESVERKLAAGSVKTFEALMIFQQLVDPQEQYADELDQIYESFLANDDKADGAKQQAVNGLYHSVLTASVIASGFCQNQAMAKQIDAELEDFSKADNEAGNDMDQLLVGSETLFRMLTAVGSILDASGSYSDSLRELSENTYDSVTEDDDPSFKLACWLYGCVYMTDLIAKEIQA